MFKCLFFRGNAEINEIIRCATKFPLFVNRWLQQYVLVDFDTSKTSWTKHRHMVNKPFWHICDFVLASYTFGFVPNNHHLRKVLNFFFHSKKTSAEAHLELQKVYGDAALRKTTCRNWFRRFKDGDFDVNESPREGMPKNFEDADAIYYELLKRKGNITRERYRMQLMRLSRELR